MNNLEAGCYLFLCFFIGMFATVAISTLDILWLTISLGIITIFYLLWFSWFILTHDALVSGDEQDG